jgi:hypothetical protein
LRHPDSAAHWDSQNKKQTLSAEQAGIINCSDLAEWSALKIKIMASCSQPEFEIIVPFLPSARHIFQIIKSTIMKKIHFAVLFAFAMQNVHAQSWNTAGNNNITTTNFLGTTNNRNLVFKTNNTERGRLTAGGVWRFGPGPVFVQVDATGKLKVGAYTFPSTDGANGQVLKTNGAGILTWSNDEVNGSGGGANLSLSNLSSTAVNQSLVPDATNTRDLGSFDLSWKDIYSTGAIYLNGLKFLWSPPGGNNVAVGYLALPSNTGAANTAIGLASLNKNESGEQNVAAGANSL